jgi:sulfide:quinone oxidoreductase
MTRSEIKQATAVVRDALNDPERRRWIKALGAVPLSAGLFSLSGQAHAAIKTNAHIVIAGSGLGGVALANRLTRMLDGVKITLIDAKEEHNYQPGYTLVATGVWPVEKVRERNADYHPSGVTWKKAMVSGFDPDSNTVTTSTGEKIKYDFLVVATGVHLDYGLIEGMDVSAIGQNGLMSVYPSPQAAVATWNVMEAFAKKGGQALMTLPATPLKCAGAPLKMTFMLRDRLAQAGTLAQSKIQFQSALTNVFGVKVVNDNVLKRWSDLGIQVGYEQTLKSIDLSARKAAFTQKSGEVLTVPYDVIHVVPPMRAPDSVKNSPLAWQSGPMAAGGWLEVDKSTLQHQRYKNVFGIGDINGTPRGKTAATIKKSAPIVANNLVRALQQQESNMTFDGYTSCPLITREGSAMLIEFDYEGKLTPTLPFIEPLQDSYFAWLMKYSMLKPAYIATLKGNV